MMKSNKKAEMGVGTLIIFIAMLLVAAVAAGVLLQTAGSLQQRALSTGQAAQGEISTNVRVIEVSGTDGTAGNITDFIMQAKLAPGSNPIKLDEVILTLNTDTSTTTLQYSGSDAFETNATTFTGEFGIEYLIEGSPNSATSGNLQQGDVVRFLFESPEEITEGERVRINLIPKIGTSTLVMFNTPDVISTERVYLFP